MPSTEDTGSHEQQCARVLASKAFRRLAGKTQVVCSPHSPHLRTRLTHTLEVASTARQVARRLRLDEDLTEAIALAHDLGHPAFGHAGERALARLVKGGFHHAAQSVRVVTVLENLHLSEAVLDGVLKHSKGKGGAIFGKGGGLSGASWEARVVRAADLFAYCCHDLEDALEMGLLRAVQLPSAFTRSLPHEPQSLRGELIERTVQESVRRGEVALDDAGFEALQSLRTFLFENVYEVGPIATQSIRVGRIVQTLWEERGARFGELRDFLLGSGIEIPLVEESFFADAIGSMTDRQALQFYEEGGHRPWSAGAKGWGVLDERVTAYTPLH